MTGFVLGPVEPDVRKIAVLRANALGDFIFTLPALEALRATYPSAEIVLLGRDWHREFLEGRPGPVDRVVPVPPSWSIHYERGHQDDPPEISHLFDALMDERFDIAAQFHGGGRYSNPFLRRLGARLTIGLRARDAEQLDRSVPYVYYQHEVLRYLEVVALIGARTDAIWPTMMVTPRDRAEARQRVPETDQPIVVLHPGASDPRRRWPVERFAAVGDALAGDGACVAVTGTPAERDLTAGVARRMRREALDLGGALSLHGLTGLLARADLIVSNDTGPLHLAAAVGARTVGIYWCGNAITSSVLSRADHRPLISWRLACPECGLDCTRGSCEHQASFVADVEVEEALTSARELLGQEWPPAWSARRSARISVIGEARVRT